jgi:leader peptidase (prepilin peptidase)/N-methyltransferase
MDPIFAVAALIIGACIGSFINVVVYRIPNPNESFWTTRSYCFTCRKPIASYDLIPILSWLILRGRCRNCQAKFSWRYPLVEFGVAALALTLYWKLGLSIELLEWFIFCATLIAIGLIDLDTWLVPSVPPIFLMVTGLAFGYYHTATLWNARTFGLLFGYGLLAAVVLIGTWAFRRSGRLQAGETAMGWGDPMIFGAIGAYLGILELTTTLLLSSIQALVLYGFFTWTRQAPEGDDWTPPTRALPFGPFLALAAIEQVLWNVSV